MKNLEESIQKNREMTLIAKNIYAMYFDKEMTMDTPITPFENHLLNIVAEMIHVAQAKKGECGMTINRITIRDLIDIIHYTLIEKFGRNEFYELTNAIHRLTNHKRKLHDVEISEKVLKALLGIEDKEGGE